MFFEKIYYFLFFKFKDKYKKGLNFMRKIKNKKYHYFYKITNLLNNHFYYGIHSTDDLEDGYMGSGTRLNYAYKKYGIENFVKEIIKFFDTREECSNYEVEMVNEELVHNKDCYNVIMGGDSFATNETITVKDENGNCFHISKYDERWLKGELVGSTKGFINCYDIFLKKYVQVSKEEYYNNDRYVGLTCGFIAARKIGTEEKFGLIKIDDFLSNRDEYETPTTNKILTKDKFGNTFMVNKSDERLKNGELVNFWKDRKHKEESKQKMKEAHKLNKHQQGEKNSQYGTCWVMKEGINKKIKKEELEKYLENGWLKGRKMK